MSNAWLDLQNPVEYNLADLNNFQRLLRQQYCKAVRSGTYLPTIQTVQKVAVDSSCESNITVQTLQTSLVSVQAQQQDLFNFNKWIASNSGNVTAFGI